MGTFTVVTYELLAARWAVGSRGYWVIFVCNGRARLAKVLQGLGDEKGVLECLNSIVRNARS